MTTDLEQRGIFRGASVSWDPGMGWLRYGCIVDIIDDKTARVVASNGCHNLTIDSLTPQPNIDNPIKDDLDAVWGWHAQ